MNMGGGSQGQGYFPGYTGKGYGVDAAYMAGWNQMAMQMNMMKGKGKGKGYGFKGMLFRWGLWMGLL